MKMMGAALLNTSCITWSSNNREMTEDTINHRKMQTNQRFMKNADILSLMQQNPLETDQSTDTDKGDKILPHHDLYVCF